METVAGRWFRNIALAVVPEAATLSEAEWQEFTLIIQTALSRRPPAMRRQLHLFLKIINILCMLRFGRTLTRATIAQRTLLLNSLQDSRLLLLRRGFWGVRTLVYMGYYARPAMSPGLGYRAGPRGWEVRR